LKKGGVVLICRILWSAGTAKVSAEQCQYLNAAGMACHLDYIRAGPNSAAYTSYLRGVDYNIIRRGSSALKPLWAFATNVAHGVPEKGVFPLEGGLDLDSIFVAALHVARHRPDVILCSDQFSGIVAYLVHRMCRTPYVVYLQEGIYEDPDRTMSHLPAAGRNRIRRLARSLDGRVLGHAAEVLGITQGSLDSVRRSGYSVPGSVVFLGAPSPPVKRVDQPREPLVLSVATWDKGRYPEIYLDIGRRLKNCKLVIAGMWRYGYQDEERRFREEIVKEHLSDRVVVTGKIDQDQLESYYGRAKVFLRLGIDEVGVGGGCLDALSWGIPIVTNRQLGISDILVDGVNGRVFDAIDTAKIARAIDDLVTDTRTYEAIREAALATARQYTWERHAELLREHLQRAMKTSCSSCG